MIHNHVSRGVAEGMQPAVVADMVVERRARERYWVFPHPEFLEIAVERFHRIANGLDPAPARTDARHATPSEIVAEIDGRHSTAHDNGAT